MLGPTPRGSSPFPAPRRSAAWSREQVKDLETELNKARNTNAQIKLELRRAQSQTAAIHAKHSRSRTIQDTQRRPPAELRHLSGGHTRPTAPRELERRVQQLTQEAHHLATKSRRQGAWREDPQPAHSPYHRDTTIQAFDSSPTASSPPHPASTPPKPHLVNTKYTVPEHASPPPAPAPPPPQPNAFLSNERSSGIPVKSIPLKSLPDAPSRLTPRASARSATSKGGSARDREHDKDFGRDVEPSAPPSRRDRSHSQHVPPVRTASSSTPLVSRNVLVSEAESPAPRFKVADLPERRTPHWSQVPYTRRDSFPMNPRLASRDDEKGYGVGRAPMVSTYRGQHPSASLPAKFNRSTRLQLSTPAAHRNGTRCQGPLRELDGDWDTRSEASLAKYRLQHWFDTIPDTASNVSDNPVLPVGKAWSEARSEVDGVSLPSSSGGLARPRSAPPSSKRSQLGPMALAKLQALLAQEDTRAEKGGGHSRGARHR